MNVLLVIPKYKVFARCTLLNDGLDEYGFSNEHLPQNTEGYILAIGELKGTPILATQKWTIHQKNKLTLWPKRATKEQLSTGIQQFPHS